MVTNSKRVNRRQSKCRRKGAVLVLLVLLLPVLIIFSAFAINIAYMELNRTEMIIATDAAARAGVRELAVTRDVNLAKDAAKRFAALNEVANSPLSLSNSDIVLGNSTRVGVERFDFISGGSNPNSMQITGKRTAGSLDGPISLLMPNVMGTSQFETEQAAVSTLMEVDIALVLDRSGSMAFASNEIANLVTPPASAPPGWGFCDPAPPICRWRDVHAAVAVFLDEMIRSPANEQVSLSTYNDLVLTDQSLTADYSLIFNAMTPYTNSLCAGGTNIGGGINEGAAALKFSPAARNGALKVIVVMTDGIHNFGTNPVNAAKNAAKDGVQIFTVTFSNEANQGQMQSVADEGGGQHYHANNASDLIAAFTDIARSLPTLLTK